MNARKPLVLCLLSALALAVSAAAGAQEAFPSTPPAPGPVPTLDIPTPQSITLDNGLRVVVAHRDGLPLVTARLLIRAGSETDPTDKAGLAALTATLLTRGAAGMDAPAMATAADALGGALESDADWDQSSLGITVTTPRLADALDLMAKAARQPAFQDAELARARKQTLDSQRLRLSQPTGMASVLAEREVFAGGSYAHPSAGTPTSLKRITRADIVRQHDTWYRPDNAILVLAGDIDTDQARQLAATAFGDWKAPAAALPSRDTGTGAAAAPKLLVVNQTGGGQAGVVATHRGIARGDKDYYIGSVANAVLGGSYSARLNEEIRIKRGLSYGAHSRLDTRRDGGQWMAVVQTKNPSAAQVVQLIETEFGKLGSAPVSDAELAARKATLTGGYARSLETTAGLASRVGTLALYDIDPAEIGKYIRRVDAVTPAQVQAFAKDHLDADGTHMIVVGDAAAFSADLKQRHPQLHQVDIDKVDLDTPAGTR